MFHHSVGCLTALLMLPLAGCRTGEPAKERPVNDAVIIRPVELLTGKVVRVYPAGRFVVIAFPPAQMPPLNHQLDVYRAGVKVGEVKISPPQREDMSVADVMTGQVQVGDQVRDR